MPRVLHVCGSINQTSQLHAISSRMPDCEHAFTPFYVDGFLELMRRRRMLEFVGVGEKLAGRTREYLGTHGLTIDYRGAAEYYDLVFLCTDIVVPKNLEGKRVILVQEGMTDPENLIFRIVKAMRLPRYFAGTAASGLSHAYEAFAVASKGYRDLFIRKGVDPAKLYITGIPNFDNCVSYLDNTLPIKKYVLAATSDYREQFKWENRKRFIYRCLDIADGRQLVFKFHPNENASRARREVERYAPSAMCFEDENTNHLIANCDVLITRTSSVVYVGMALGKDVYSDFTLDELRRLCPIQNGGTSAAAIAEIGYTLLSERLAGGFSGRRTFQVGRLKSLSMPANNFSNRNMLEHKPQ